MTIADQPRLSDDELRALLDAYRAQYSVEYDEVLRQLEHKTCFGQHRRTLIGHLAFSNVTGVAFSPDGRLLATAGDDGTLLWD